MRILITGGYGFIGSHVAERFSKEGHQVVVVDALLAGSKENLTVKHTFYQLNIADKKCEEVFRVNNFDVVVHLAAQVDVNTSENNPCLDIESNILGLVNMLDLASKYHVKKFIFASSAAVYGNAETMPITERAPLKPISVYGINKVNGEEYCLKWKEIYGLNTAIVRFSNVYGPRQSVKGEGAVIPAFITKVLKSEKITIYGSGKQIRDYVYVEDIVDALYRLAMYNKEVEIMNVSTNTECNLDELVNMLSTYGKIKEIEYKEKRQGDIDKSKLDNSQCIKELGWSPKYTLQEGLGKTYQWYKNELASQSVQGTEENMTVKFLYHKFAVARPYIENLLMFCIMLALTLTNTYGSIINTSIGLDYNYIYIVAMGLLYGKKQSIPATILSSALLMYSFLLQGADFVAIAYQSQHIVHFATYLFIGVVTGYVTDSRERVASDQNIVLKNTKERYQFLETMYLENVTIKDKLYKQIVNSNDSLGKTYQIIHKLDSIEVEKIFTASNEVVAEIMHTDSVAIYIVGKNGYYLRQKTRTSEKLDHLPRSLKIESFDYLKKMMKDKKVFTNKRLNKDCPHMAAPVIFNNDVIAVLQIYQLPFESLNLYHENLLKITAMLISEALGKAYLHEQSVQDKKYIGGTRILIAEEFEKIQLEMALRQKNSNQLSVALIKILTESKDYNQIYKEITGVIRDEDFIGVKKDGYVYVMLLDISADMVFEVQKRIKKVGLDTVDMIGDTHD